MRLAGSDVRLVVERNPPPSAERGGLNRALGVVIKDRVEANGVCRISFAETKRLLCGSASATRADLIAAVAERHPVCRLPETPKRVGVKPYGIVGVLAVALAASIRHAIK